MKGRTEKEKIDKLDDTTYLTIRGFRERNILGKKMDYDGRVLPTVRKVKGHLLNYCA